MKDGRDDTNFNELRAVEPQPEEPWKRRINRVRYAKCGPCTDLSWRGGKQGEKTPGPALWFLCHANLANGRESHSYNDGMIGAYVRLTIALASREDRHGEPIGRPASRLRRPRHWPWTREPSRLAGRAVNAGCFKSSTPRSFTSGGGGAQGCIPEKATTRLPSWRLRSRRRDAVQSRVVFLPRAPSLRFTVTDISVPNIENKKNYLYIKESKISLSLL